MATRLPLLQASLFIGIAWVPLGTASAWAQTPVQNPANNQYYQIITSARPIAWHEANAAARSASFNGMVGYLATITSAREEEFVVQTLPRLAKVPGWAGGWLGGYRDPTSAKVAVGWQWVTGEPWQYTHWRDGEPNNAGGLENRLCLDSTKVWNDMANDPVHGPHQYPVFSYVIEYGKIVRGTSPRKTVSKANHAR